MSSLKDIVSTLRELPDFQSFVCAFDCDAFAKFAEGVSLITVPPETVLFEAQSPVEACYIVTSGSVKLVVHSATGNEAIMTFRRRGHFIAAGVLILSDTPVYPVAAVTLEETMCLKIPIKTFQAAWRHNPKIVSIIQKTLLDRYAEYHFDKAIAGEPVSIRLAHFLLKSLDEQPHDESGRLNFRLSRQNIADRIGTTVETVIRILSQWNKNRWISTQDQQLSILDREGLRSVLNNK